MTIIAVTRDYIVLITRRWRYTDVLAWQPGSRHMICTRSLRRPSRTAIDLPKLDTLTQISLLGLDTHHERRYDTSGPHMSKTRTQCGSKGASIVASDKVRFTAVAAITSAASLSSSFFLDEVNPAYAFFPPCLPRRLGRPCMRFGFHAAVHLLGQR